MQVGIDVDYRKSSYLDFVIRILVSVDGKNFDPLDPTPFKGINVSRLSEQVFFQSFGVSENRIGTFFRNSRIGLENKLKISFSGEMNMFL